MSGETVIGGVQPGGWLVAAITVAGLIIVAWINSRASRKMQDQVKQQIEETNQTAVQKTEEVKEAVTNNHPTHIREDIDMLLALLREIDDKANSNFDDTRKDIGGIREELREERKVSTGTRTMLTNHLQDVAPALVEWHNRQRTSKK